MLEILAYIGSILGIIASVIEILQFFKILSNKYKGLVFIIVCISTVICFLTWYKIDERNETQKLENVKSTYLLNDAKSTTEGITTTGYGNAGDYLSCLIQITGFYNRHKDKFSFEYETYKKEVENWSKIINEKKSKGEVMYTFDYMELEGLVKSGKSNIEHLFVK